jgi:hypothetical protein
MRERKRPREQYYIHSFEKKLATNAGLQLRNQSTFVPDFLAQLDAAEPEVSGTRRYREKN